jgi:predicted nucleic acid-binding protein
VPYLVDTKVISELRKGERADPGVASWFADLAEEEEVYLSVLTLGEIRRGIESIRRRDPEAGGALESWLGRVSEAHRDRILPIDRSTAEEWGRMNVPDPLPVVRWPARRDGEGDGPYRCHPQQRRFRKNRRQLRRPFQCPS